MLMELISKNLGGAELLKEGAILKAWSLFNFELAANFVTQRGILTRRMEEDPGLFRRDDWQKHAQRKEVRTPLAPSSPAHLALAVARGDEGQVRGARGLGSLGA